MEGAANEWLEPGENRSMAQDQLQIAHVQVTASTLVSS
jgi:hypothetical protein